MARKSKSNTKLFIGLYILLILITIAGLGTYYYYDKEIKNKKELQTEEDKKLEEKEQELKNEEALLSEEENKFKDYDNLDEKIENLKTEYYKSIKELEDSILAGTSDKKIAYLTFDDGPYYSTYKVFEILDKYNVKATFFTTNINGENCFDNKSENCQVMYKEYLKRGHTLANHTYTHGIGRGLYASADTFMTAVINQENLIKDLTGGYITNIVRFPGGTRTAGKLKEPIAAKLKERGYGWVDWTCEDGDGGDLKSKEQAWANIKYGLNSNIEVILLHDYNKITISILPELIEYLQEKGYVLLPLFYESNMINK